LCGSIELGGQIPASISRMNQDILRNAEPSGFDAIVRLNEAEVQHTSAMDVARLRELDALACYHKVACVDGTVAAVHRPV
jgi:hypothetical protein